MAVWCLNEENQSTRSSTAVSKLAPVIQVQSEMFEVNLF